MQRRAAAHPPSHLCSFIPSLSIATANGIDVLSEPAGSTYAVSSECG